MLDEQGQNRWLLTRVERAKPAAPRKLKGKSVADVLATSAWAEIQIAELKTEQALLKGGLFTFEIR